MLARADRESVAKQQAALTDARETWRAALDGLASAARRERFEDVEAEADDLARALRSRAKRPPVVDGSALAGAVSAVYRTHMPSDHFDAVWALARGAEQGVDSAAYDLATASGADG